MKRKNNNGFTFIELILYMAILGIFMVAVMSIVGTTVASNKKQRSRQKLQTQATEAYDSISDMLMSANNVMIHGDGYVKNGTAYSKVTGSFIVPYSRYIKGTGGKLLMPGGSSDVERQLGISYSKCYDIGDVKPFGDAAAASKDAETFIDTDYLWISYGSEMDTTSFCTVKYDSSAKKLYLIRRSTDITGADHTEYQNALTTVRTTNLDKYEDGTTEKQSVTDKLNQAESCINGYSQFLDSSSADGILLAKNVTAFKVQVNPDDNSVALTIEFEDSQTGETYKATGVVGIRNSFVLKPHEWN